MEFSIIFNSFLNAFLAFQDFAGWLFEPMVVSNPITTLIYNLMTDHVIPIIDKFLPYSEKYWEQAFIESGGGAIIVSPFTFLISFAIAVLVPIAVVVSIVKIGLEIVDYFT